MHNKLKICCVTGHRKIPPEKIDYVRGEIAQKVSTAIDAGYNFFISGFADGVDIVFAEIVADMARENKSIHLEAALPYPRERTKRDIELLKLCDAITTISDKYHHACFMKRNEYMVDQSSLIIAVYDGRYTGGTYRTIQYARNRNKEIEIIEV